MESSALEYDGVIKNKEVYPQYQASDIIQLSSINQHYPNKQALYDINLSIKNREIVFITGNSGAGKSTLLNIISGQLKPSSGTVCVDQKLFIASVFQDLKLIEEYTLIENLEIIFNSSVHIQDLIEYFNLKNLKNELVKNLCGGEKQKVAFIRALIAKPDILIADEPTSALDSHSANAMFELISFYNVKKGLTVLWATHDSNMVKSFSGRCVHLDQGKIIHSGSTCFI
ncbi:ATP-binding cassette domain-containing protein [Bacteriovoracaceae bacterium]|nr:ATP-binding cassette domain-containing protein [Bacteriovoracaceae bacterium]